MVVVVSRPPLRKTYPPFEVVADDLPPEGREIAEHIPEGPADGVVAAKRLVFHDFQDADEGNRCEQSSADADVDVGGVLPLPDGGLLLGKREEGPDGPGSRSFPPPRGCMGVCCFSRRLSGAGKRVSPPGRCSRSFPRYAGLRLKELVLGPSAVSAIYVDGACT